VMARRVGSVAQRTPIAVTPRTPLVRVVRKLVESGAKSFPVVDRDRVVGVVAREDVMNALRRFSAGEGPSP
jgi:CBS domain-containing protein